MSLSLPKICSMGGSNTGLVGTIGVTLLDPDGTTHTARATADIYEIGGGCYGKEITFEDNWKGVLLWDTGGGSPVYASEEYHIGAIWDEILTGATHNVATSAGRRLRQIAALTIHDGTAQAGTANTITFDAGASATDGIYCRNLCVIVGGTGAGQTRAIVEYNGTTKLATVSRNWKVSPDDTSEFQLVARDKGGRANHGYAQAGGPNTITLEAAASSDDNIYIGMMIIITTGTACCQARLITAYNGTSKVATVYPAWTLEPDITSVYHIDFDSYKIVGSIAGTPSAALVDAIWNELQSGHIVAGSFGKYLDQEISTIAAAIGSGLLSCTWTQRDGQGNPMDGVSIWICTDEAGSNVVAGAIYTNTAGEALFHLDAGTYKVFRQLAGYNFSNPQTWTVS